MIKSLRNNNNCVCINISFGCVVSRLLTITKEKDDFNIECELSIFDKYGKNETPYFYGVDFDVIRNLHIKKFTLQQEELKSLVKKYVVYILEKTTTEKLISMTKRYYVIKEDIEMPAVVVCDICVNNKLYSVKNEEFIKVICDIIQNNFTCVDPKYEVHH
jgi:hypothetical protein